VRVQCVSEREMLLLLSLLLHLHSTRGKQEAHDCVHRMSQWRRLASFAPRSVLGGGAGGVVLRLIHPPLTSCD